MPSDLNNNEENFSISNVQEDQKNQSLEQPSGESYETHSQNNISTKNLYGYNKSNRDKIPNQNDMQNRKISTTEANTVEKNSIGKFSGPYTSKSFEHMNSKIVYNSRLPKYYIEKRDVNMVLIRQKTNRTTGSNDSGKNSSNSGSDLITDWSTSSDSSIPKNNHYKAKSFDYVDKKYRANKFDFHSKIVYNSRLPKYYIEKREVSMVLRSQKQIKYL